MFKRLFWLSVGMGFGFGASFWVRRALRRAASRLTVDAATELLATARRLGDEVLAALSSRSRHPADLAPVTQAPAGSPGRYRSPRSPGAGTTRADGGSGSPLALRGAAGHRARRGPSRSRRVGEKVAVGRRSYRPPARARGGEGQAGR